MHSEAYHHGGLIIPFPVLKSSVLSSLARTLLNSYNHGSRHGLQRPNVLHKSNQDPNEQTHRHVLGISVYMLIS